MAALDVFNINGFRDSLIKSKIQEFEGLLEEPVHLTCAGG